MWMLVESARGKGYASEGAKAAIDFGLNTLTIPRIAAIIRHENKSSIRLAERLGMGMEKEVERQKILFYQYIIKRN